MVHHAQIPIIQDLTKEQSILEQKRRNMSLADYIFFKIRLSKLQGTVMSQSMVTNFWPWPSFHQSRVKPAQPYKGITYDAYTWSSHRNTRCQPSAYRHQYEKLLSHFNHSFQQLVKLYSVQRFAEDIGYVHFGKNPNTNQT